jgi:hypothetical protein
VAQHSRGGDPHESIASFYGSGSIGSGVPPPFARPICFKLAAALGHPGVQMGRVSIDTGDVIDGQLAPAKTAVIRDWCTRHRVVLRADWQRAQLNLHPIGRYDQ